MFAPSVGAGVRRAPFAGVQPRRVPAGPALAASGSRRVVARANPDDKQEAAKKAVQESLQGMFKGKDILAEFDSRGGGGGGRSGGGGGGWGDFWGSFRDPNEWRRFGFGMFQTAVGFTRETFSFLVALSAFVAVIWAAGNIPAVLHLIQLAIIKALRLDGGSKRARLESKVKAAKESAGKGADSLGVAESTVMARWVSDNEDEGDEE